MNMSDGDYKSIWGTSCCCGSVFGNSPAEMALRFADESGGFGEPLSDISLVPGGGAGQEYESRVQMGCKLRGRKMLKRQRRAL